MNKDTVPVATPELADTLGTGVHSPEALAQTGAAPQQPRVKAQSFSGRRLGDFVVQEPLGEGGFGVVYRAEQLSLGREAVIKVPLRGGRSPAALQRFLREAHVASRLDHPYAAHVYAFGNEPDGTFWIAMERVHGTPLDEHLRFGGAWPLARAVPFLVRLAEVVHRAHELGIVHRDIKPPNVMVLEQSGRLLPKLLDFGIARAFASPELEGGASARGLTQHGILIGSPGYMAPEQWTDASSVGPAADVYALGVLAYELCTGAPPFIGKTLAELEQAHAQLEPPALPDGLGALEPILRRALAKIPGERFASALEMANALEGAVRPALPRLGALADAPRPIADVLATIDRASSAHEARGALDAAVLAIAQWLGVLALAARARTGPPPGGDRDEARERLRELRRRGLDAAGWLALARELTRPFADRRELFPIPELVRTAGAIDALAARTHTQVPDATARELLRTELDTLARALGELRGIFAYRLVLDPEPTVLDADGAPALLLAPLVQVAPPIPGAPAEVFVLAGDAAGGARLVANPIGFECVDPELWDWLGARVLEDTGSAASSAHLERPPYRGLAPLTAADADLFFGRDKEIREVANRLKVQRLVAIVGRSGSGKSSFVQAGLIPALGLRTVILRPGATPSLAGTEDAELIFVDQLEELFTLCGDPAERRAFMAALLRARARVIVTLRDDYLANAAELGPAIVLLAAPGPAELERIVSEPARRAGYRFDDPSLPARMVTEVGDRPGGLALLAFAAAELWERRDRSFKRLLVAEYDAMGGVAGALVGHAEAWWAGLTGGEQKLVREAFRHLVTADGTRATIARSELAEIVGGVIEKLIASRLVVASEDDVEVAHETLLENWPRVVGWRREDAEGARLRDQLRSAARQWDERGRPRGLLWRDDALAEYRIWQHRHAVALGGADLAFARASEAEDARGVRRRRGLITGAIAALAIVAIALGVLGRRAALAADEARARLVASYLAAARTDLDNGHRWRALDDVQRARDMGARSPALTLMSALAAAPAKAIVARLTGNPGRLWSVRYAPDGHALITAGEGGAAIWDAAGALRARVIDRGTVRDAAWSPDGTRVATAGFQIGVQIFDDRGAAIRKLDGAKGNTRCIAWQRDGRWLAAASEDGDVVVWDAASGAITRTFSIGPGAAACDFGPTRLAIAMLDGRVVIADPDSGDLTTLGKHADAVRSVKWDAAGTRLVTASHDKTVRIWDARDGHVLAELVGASDALLDAEWSPDQRTIVGASRDGTARVWDVATGRLALTLQGHRGTVWTASFDRAGARIITAGDDGTARIWDAATGAVLAVLEGHTQVAIRAELAPDGVHAVTASYDGSAVVWDTTPPFLAEQWPGSDATSCFHSAIAAGRLAVACPDASRGFDLAARKPSAPLPGGFTIDLSADGTRALTRADGASSVTVSDATTGAPITQLALPTPITSAAFVGARVAVSDGNAVHVFEGDRELGSVPGMYVFGANNGRSVTLAADGTIRVIDGTSVLASFDGPGGADDAIGERFGDTVAIAGALDGSLALVDTRTPKIIWLRGHSAPVLSAQFDAAGARIVTTSEDGTTAIWDTSTGTLLHRFSASSGYLRGASFDPSGALVAAVDGHGDLWWFDASTGDELGRIDGTGRPGLDVRFVGPRTVAVAGLAGDVAIYQVPQGDDDLTRFAAVAP